ncbi:MAG: fatty acid desaturase, partial [Paracoccaceae bacterium]|nr:fatty acid desaturase [Paracoccaceae bacterium]
MIPPQQVSRISSALPFWLSLGTLPLAVIGAAQGGWAVLLLPIYTWGLFSLLDAVTGLNLENADPTMPEQGLFWYRLITLIWFPLEFCVLFGTIWYVTHSGHLTTLEKVGLFFGMGVISGTVGINYSHELMHQKSRLERWFGDLLLACVLYSHFRTEHLRVHHPWVGTPRDT